MKINIFFLIFLASIFFSLSCSKKKGCTDNLSISYDPSAEKDDGTCEYGGDGGKNTINLTLWSAYGVSHSVISLQNYLDSVYVKYNAIGVPGTNNAPGGDQNLYDKVYTGIVGDSTINISGLKKGKYYIYITAFDTAQAFNTRVTHGFPIVLYEDEYTTQIITGLSEHCCTF